jgi:hypothetical protein
VEAATGGASWVPAFETHHRRRAVISQRVILYTGFTSHLSSFRGPQHIMPHRPSTLNRGSATKAYVPHFYLKHSALATVNKTD